MTTTPQNDQDRPVRIGLLSAANIAPAALIDPASRLNVEVVAVAARDPRRARDFAQAHGIAEVAKSYEELLDRDDLDAVYVPLPPALRFEWTMRALQRGLHILAEKPLAMDARQAREMVDEAERRGLVLAEGFHYMFHPMFSRALSLVAEGGLGETEHLEAIFHLAATAGAETEVYTDAALGGGSLMHEGCYNLHALRMLGGGEPTVTSASAVIGESGVDESIAVDLAFPDGTTGHSHSSFAPDVAMRMEASVRGSRGTMTLHNFIGPHAGNQYPATGGRIQVVADGRTTVDESFTGDTTYTYQLQAFCAAVRGGPAMPTQGEGAAATMVLLDAARKAASL